MLEASLERLSQPAARVFLLLVWRAGPRRIRAVLAGKESSHPNHEESVRRAELASACWAEELETMAEAGERILECYRVLAKSGSNVVAEVLRGQGTFRELDHYPDGDVYDPQTHSQHYYHSHREGEHGHFHTFLRGKGIPDDCRPVEQSEADFMKERDDSLSHLIAISMNHAGFPIALFTTNRWITADDWYKADDVIKMLDRFEMDLSWPSWPVNIWITAMLRLFRPQIVQLIRERDAAVADWRKQHPDRDAFEDRGCDITSTRRISVAAQINRVHMALKGRRPG